MPWSTFLNAVFEIVTSVCLVGMSFVGLQFADEASRSEIRTAAILMYLWSCLIWVLFFLSVLVVLKGEKQKQVKGDRKSKEGMKLLSTCVDVQKNDQENRLKLMFQDISDYQWHIMKECDKLLMDMQDASSSWKRPGLAAFKLPTAVAGHAPQEDNSDVKDVSIEGTVPRALYFS